MRQVSLVQEWYFVVSPSWMALLLHHLRRSDSLAATLLIITSPNRFWNLSKSVSWLLVPDRFFRAHEDTGCSMIKVGVSLRSLPIAIISNGGSLGALCHTANDARLETRTTLVSVWLARRGRNHINRRLVRAWTRATRLFSSDLRNFYWAWSFGKCVTLVEGMLALRLVDNAVWLSRWVLSNIDHWCILICYVRSH